MKKLYARISPYLTEINADARTTAVDHAINNLPRDNRQALLLHYRESIPRKAIAQQLGWSESKVHAKITRGISLLRRALNPAAFDRANALWQNKQEKQQDH